MMLLRYAASTCLIAAALDPSLCRLVSPSLSKRRQVAAAAATPRRRARSPGRRYPATSARPKGAAAAVPGQRWTPSSSLRGSPLLLAPQGQALESPAPTRTVPRPPRRTLRPMPLGSAPRTRSGRAARRPHSTTSPPMPRCTAAAMATPHPCTARGGPRHTASAAPIHPSSWLRARLAVQTARCVVVGVAYIERRQRGA